MLPVHLGQDYLCCQARPSPLTHNVAGSKDYSSPEVSLERSYWSRTLRFHSLTSSPQLLYIEAAHTPVWRPDARLPRYTRGRKVCDRTPNPEASYMVDTNLLVPGNGNIADDRKVIGNAILYDRDIPNM